MDNLSLIYDLGTRGLQLGPSKYTWIRPEKCMKIRVNKKGKSNINELRNARIQGCIPDMTVKQAYTVVT